MGGTNCEAEVGGHASNRPEATVRWARTDGPRVPVPLFDQPRAAHREARRRRQTRDPRERAIWDGGRRRDRPHRTVPMFDQRRRRCGGRHVADGEAGGRTGARDRTEALGSRREDGVRGRNDGPGGSRGRSRAGEYRDAQSHGHRETAGTHRSSGRHHRSLLSQGLPTIMTFAQGPTRVEGHL